MRDINLFRRRYLNPVCDIQELIYVERPYSCYTPSNITYHRNMYESPAVASNGLAGFENIQKRELNKERSDRRAKKSLKYLVLNNVNANWRFLTLTYSGEGQQNRNQLYRDVEVMFEKFRLTTVPGIKYILVVEYHKDKKRMHCHILCNLPYMRNEEIEDWYWPHGFAKLEKLKSHGKSKSLIQILHYVSKYITKESEETIKNKKRYTSSRNLIKKPITTQGLLNHPQTFTQMIADLERVGWLPEHTFSVNTDHGVMTGVILVYPLQSRLCERRETRHGAELGL